MKPSERIDQLAKVSCDDGQIETALGYVWAIIKYLDEQKSSENERRS